MCNMKCYKEHIIKLLYGIISKKLPCAVVSYVVGMLCVRYDAQAFLVFYLLFLLVIFVLNIIRIKMRHLTECILFMLIFYIIGMTVMYEADKRVWNFGNTVCFTGKIIDRIEYGYSNCYTVNMGSFYHMAYIYTDSEECYSLGSVIKIVGTPTAFDSAENEGQFDSNKYYKSKNIDAKIEDAKIEVIREGKNSIYNGMYLFKEKLSRIILKNCPDNGGVLNGILTGDKSSIPDQVKEVYQYAGISHILAISGLHVTNISLIIGFLLLFFRIPKKVSMFVSVLFLILYSLFSGMSASVFRAVSMYVFTSMAFFTGRKYDMPIALSFSLFLYSLMYPHSIFSSGTILSYLAVVSIYIYTIFYRKIHVYKEATKFRRFIKNKIYKPFSLGLFLSVFSFPIVIYFFNTYPLLSVFVNMYVIVLMPVLFILGIVACVMIHVFGPLAVLLFKICDYIISSYLFISKFTVEKLNSVIVIGKPKIYEIVIFYLFMFIIIFVFSDLKKKWISMLIMCIPIALIIYRNEDVAITMLNVDQGECIHISNGEGEHILVDCGSLGDTKVYNNRVEPYLLSNGISELEYVFLSHADNDHINGIVQYFENTYNLIDVNNIVITYDMYKNESVYNSIILPAIEDGTNIILIEKGDYILSKPLIFECLHPNNYSTYEDSNDASMVLKMTVNDKTALFTGDISKAIENTIAIGDIDILKVSHHGSKTATSESFLIQTNPEYALISCGKNNSYGHPHQEIITRLKAEFIKVFNTTEDGAVRILLD